MTTKEEVLEGNVVKSLTTFGFMGFERHIALRLPVSFQQISLFVKCQISQKFFHIFVLEEGSDPKIGLH